MRIAPRPWPPPLPKEMPVKRYDPGHFVQRHAMPYDIDLWARVQERDNEWLSSQSWVIGWETNPPSVHFDREETIIWISDKEYLKNVPKILFGLPTTIFLSEQVFNGSPYRTHCDTKETLLKRNFNNIWEKIIFKFKMFWKCDKG